MNHTRTHKTVRSLLVWLLMLTMVFSLLPMAAFADDAGEPVVSEEPVQEPEPSSEPTEAPSEPTQEPTQEPEPEQPGNAVVTIEGDEEQPEDELLAEEISFNYAEKTQSVRLSNGEFQRIFLLDCGRKYFTTTEVKAIIDELQKNHYTHIELAFGNDALRFILNDTSLTANGKDYTSAEVTDAIEYGNQQFCANNKYDTSASSAAWSQTDMDDIISYAGEHGIKVVPLFNAPGHMFAVVKAMENLGLTNAGSKVGYADSSPNWGLDVTNPAAVNFVQALVEKYIAYFAGKGCTMFNIGADESGINKDNYSAYAQLVNSHAAMVQNSGMVAMAFNDGIYNPNYTAYLNGVAFDSDIVIAYWSYSGLAKAKSLADMGFVINSTHNNWYYVLGKNDSSWAGYNTAINNMKTVKCNAVDSGITTNSGCTLAVWCDNPYVDYNANSSNVKTLISTFASENSGYFVAPQKPVLTVSKSDIAVGDTVTLTLSNYEGNVNWSCDKPDVLSLEQGNSNSVTATALSVGTAAVTATMADGEAVTISINVAETVFNGETEAVDLYLDGEVTKTYTPKGQFEYVEDADLLDADGNVIAKYSVTNTPGTEAVFQEAKSVSTGNSYVIKNSDGSYKTQTGDTTNSLNEAARWTLSQSYGSKYYLKSGDYYLYYSNAGWNSNSGWKVTTTRQVVYLKSETIYGSYSWYNDSYSNELKTLGTVTESTEAKDEIVFTALTAGSSSIIIGDVQYDVTVHTADLSKVTPLPIQLWITDNTIEADGPNAGTTGSGWRGSEGKVRYINVPAAAKNDSASINSKQGMAVVDAFAAAGMGNPVVRYELGGTRFIAPQGNKPAIELAFWTGRIHNTLMIQDIWATDYSNSGEEFTFVRYWGGEWQVSADRQSWTTVTGEGSTGNMSGCKEQLVAYYMMRTKVTDEVTTDAADWGYPAGSADYDDQLRDTAGYVLLDFAVKYEDGTRNPKTFPKTGKTLAFNINQYGTGESGIKYRVLNNFRAMNSSDYEVYMVTVTMTNDAASANISNTASYTYEGKEQVVWARDEATLNNSGLDPYTSISGENSVFSGCKFGGDPYVRGVEVYNKHGALITYYVRAIIKEDSLKVHYINRSADDHEFYNYGITVNEGTLFAENFGQVGENSTLLQGNTVTNSLGVEQTVTAELKDIPAIGAQYRYSDYTCVGASRSADGKDVYLYYTFKASKVFVVDFGLPMKIEPKDVNANLANASLTRVVAKNSNYADVTVKDLIITYTLNKTINGRDDVVATYYGTQNGSEEHNVTYTLSFIPATNVYYEDSFARFDSGKNNAANAVWQSAGTKAEATQALEELGKKQNSYGYDDAYSKNKTTLFSLGSAQYVTLTKEMSAGGDTPTADWPTVSFDFKGTGFEIMSVTDNKAGTIFVKVFDKSGTQERFYMVDNYYGYSYVDGKWVVNPNSTDALYQIPVIKIQDLAYGEHKVVVTAFYDELVDHTCKGSCTFYFDGFRVYNPLNPDNDTANKTYEKDQEGYPQYIKLRDEVIKNGGERVFFIDGAANANVTQYKNGGPKNEVYLAKGQAISFTVTGNNIDTIQIGAKAPKGAAVLNVNDTKIKALETATEMYYDITAQAKGKQVTITNTGDGILSLTDVKVTFTTNATASLAELGEDEAVQAVSLVRSLYAAPEVEPVEPFKPDHFEAKWSNNVRQGGRAVLTVKTSADVEEIIINGDIVVSNYKTRTERVGYGRNAERVTYHVFTYMISAQQSAEYSVVAVNEAGLMSEAVAARLTVRPKGPIKDWFDGLFGRWF